MDKSEIAIFELPPGGSISDKLKQDIISFREQRKPLKWLARMRGVPVMFIYFLDREIKTSDSK